MPPSDIRARGGVVTGPVDGVRGHEAFVVDPAGQQIGLRATPRHPTLAADREARRRALRGEAFNPGCASMPSGWRELGWVQLRAADPARRSTLLDLGDAVTLKIVAGGSVRAAPAAQYASTAAMILRVRGLDGLVAAKVPRVGKRYVTQQGSWLYVAAPEGNVVGLREWNHPSAYAAKTPPVPTDLEAARRAVEARTAPRHNL